MGNSSILNSKKALFHVVSIPTAICLHQTLLKDFVQVVLMFSLPNHLFSSPVVLMALSRDPGFYTRIKQLLGCV